jgi:density-regulated protein
LLTGLDGFGIKMAEAAKLFGKKFASGAAVTKSPTEKDQIDIQGDCLDKLPELILKTWGKTGDVTKADIYFIDNKKKVSFYDDDDGDEE